MAFSFMYELDVNCLAIIETVIVLKVTVMVIFATERTLVGSTRTTTPTAESAEVASGENLVAVKGSIPPFDVSGQRFKAGNKVTDTYH